MSIFIYPYTRGSASVNALRNALGARVIKRDASRYVEGRGNVIINWGASQVPYTLDRIINTPDAVRRASNKLEAFDQLSDNDVVIPDYTTDGDQVIEWLEEGFRVVARHVLNGHSGEGIEILDENCWNDDPEGWVIPNAPLYVKYVPKRDEFRVHVMGNDIIHIQQKRRRLDVPDDAVNWQVRNHSNGFIFAAEDIDVAPMVLDQAILAVHSLGLDFGAVDVIWNNNRQMAYVLEVNTAPGLEGQTVEAYAAGFRNLLA